MAYDNKRLKDDTQVFNLSISTKMVPLKRWRSLQLDKFWRVKGNQEFFVVMTLLRDY